MKSIALTTALSIASTLGALRGIQVPEEPFATDVPPVARLLMAGAKAELRDLAVVAMHDQPADASLAAANVQLVMTTALHDAGALDACESQYGRLAEPKVTSPGTDLVAVVTDLLIPCGDDASLFLFRHDADGWHLVLDQQKNDYEEVSGGAGSFEFRVSPPDEHGSRLVATADLPPWCSSNWHSLSWNLFRINRGWSDPETVATGTEVIYVQDEVDMTVTPDTFSLNYVGSSIDPARVMRDYHRHYRITAGNRLERIEPIAASPLEFIEEWLLAKNDPDSPMGEFHHAARCAGGLLQFELWTYGDNDDEDDVITYFVVAEENGRYRMVSMGDSSRDDCKYDDPEEDFPHAHPNALPGRPAAVRRGGEDSDRSRRNIGPLQTAADGQHEDR